jgi:riboflavin kinase/FMN adenylyltransferase
MQVHRTLEELPVFRSAVITIGTFDGVHKGHQEIISGMKQVASETGGETVILTFHPHPRKVVTPEPLALLNTLEEKIELLRAQGIDHLVVIPFTQEFSKLTAEEYIGQFLVRYFKPHTIIIGYDHRFGNNRLGDFRLLEERAVLYGYRVLEIPEQVLDAVKVSSTRIRDALSAGDPILAAELLGYSYFFEGTVVQGQQLGRTLGFPTANLEEIDPDKLIPANGVYAVRVDGFAAGRVSGFVDGFAASRVSDFAASRLSGLGPAMMNIGVRPTVGGTRRVIEAHLLDFSGDLYGRRLRVELRAFLRHERRFENLDALKTQLAQDRLDTIQHLKS